jgi:hypothetical protein
MDANTIVQMVLSGLLVATTDARANLAKEVADKIADLVANSKTTIDDQIVKDAVVPFFDAVSAELKVRFP